MKKLLIILCFVIFSTSINAEIVKKVLINNNDDFKFEKINFKRLNQLNFQKINFKKFPINKILKKIPENDSLLYTVLISANDTLVDLFLNNKISFYEIYEKLNSILKFKEFSKLKSIKTKNISQIINLSHKVRLKTQSLSVISKI